VSAVLVASAVFAASAFAAAAAASSFCFCSVFSVSICAFAFSTYLVSEGRFSFARYFSYAAMA
jgi:hypothetical protein